MVDRPDGYCNIGTYIMPTLILYMLKPDISSFEQLLIRIHTLLKSACKYMLIIGILQVDSIKIGEQ